MSNPIMHVFPDVNQLSRAAADEVVRAAEQAIGVRGRFTIALSGGSTPRRLYQLFAESPHRERVRWPRVEFFWGDERTVPPDHPDSNFRMANEALLHKLDIPAYNLHRMQGERPDLAAAARDYAAEIARVFAMTSNGPPSLDLVLLGMGPEGHTASLFPDTAALKEAEQWVVANHVPQKKTYRLTMTPSLLNRATQVMFLIAGADKAAILAEVLEGPADPQRLPSQLIRPTAGNLHFFLDQAAAAQLKHLK
jgi:6-phosphogluconolactonase